MNQLNLFPTYPDSEATAVPAQRHSRTSVAAAESMKPHLNRLERIVMDFLARADDGGTDEEIAIGTGLLEGTARARRRELVQRQLVTVTPRSRPTTRGRMAFLFLADFKDRQHSPG